MSVDRVRRVGLRVGFTGAFVAGLATAWLGISSPDSLATAELIATPLLLLTLFAGVLVHAALRSARVTREWRYRAT